MTASVVPVASMAPARRAPALLLSAVLVALLAVAALPVPSAGSTDAELTATLQLPEGEIDFPLEPGSLHFFDEEGAPFVVQVIDGCAVNDHYWVFGAGLGSTDVPLTIFDERSGNSHRTVLPAFEPGGTIASVLEPTALAVCRESSVGGLPEVAGTATYTSVTPQCTDLTRSVALLSDGREDAYRLYVRDGIETDRIIGGAPAAVLDQSDEWDELHLFAEGRTPRRVEGVLFSGDPGMLPRQATLERALRDVTRARVRRAFEAAKSEIMPEVLLGDLGLRDVGCVYHVSLDFDTLGADAYLAQAGWIKDGGAALEPPALVPARFDVELVAADGSRVPLPLTGPFEGGVGAGTSWEHQAEGAKVEIVDGCSLSGSFWTVAAALSDEPVELVITDTQTGTPTSQVLSSDGEGVSTLADTAALSGCP